MKQSRQQGNSNDLLGARLADDSGGRYREFCKLTNKRIDPEGAGVQLFKTIAGLRSYLRVSRKRDGDGCGDGDRGQRCPVGTAPLGTMSVGLVPTMGALHAGHLSLIQRARQENNRVVVSIFVNPLQFGQNEDFHQYPKTLERDCQLCEAAGVDAVFAPTAEELYGSDLYRQDLYNRAQTRTAQSSAPPSGDRLALTQVLPPESMLAVLCGPVRPGHFAGVATVVTKLLNIVQPERAYFGQKDAQQLAMLQRLVQDLNLPVTLVPCPTMREPDGLAMSSRNQYLSAEERSHATILYRSLQAAAQHFHQGMRQCAELIGAVTAELATVSALQLDYVELVHPTTMTPLKQIEDTGLLAIAARLGSTRLIDNIVLRHRQPIVAIDGPAGAGKSTVARQVARQLELLYLDTGAMYRAVTWLALQSGIALGDEASVAELVSQCDLQLAGDHLAGDQPLDEAQPHSAALPTLRVTINGHDVTQGIRSLEVTSQVSAIAAQAAVRTELVKRQQDYGRRGGVVMDGRDIGTHVFPEAEVKIFLTASVQERARRRHHDLKAQGLSDINPAQLEQAIYERDQKDSSRAIAPLCKAADAIEINTDALTIAAVTAKIVGLYQEQQRQAGDRDQ